MAYLDGMSKWVKVSLLLIDANTISNIDACKNGIFEGCALLWERVY
jgi:hypothetical protein